jgi:hypothetical protein
MNNSTATTFSLLLILYSSSELTDIESFSETVILRDKLTPARSQLEQQYSHSAREIPSLPFDCDVDSAPCDAC